MEGPFPPKKFAKIFTETPLRLLVSRVFEQAWALLKGVYGDSDLDIDDLEARNILDSPFYTRNFGATPTELYGAGGDFPSLLHHLDDYDNELDRYYDPETLDRRVVDATADALPEAVRRFPNLSQFKQAPVFIPENEMGHLGTHLKDGAGREIVNLLTADAHQHLEDPFDQMKRTQQHELGHGVVDNILQDVATHEDGGTDVPLLARRVADWRDDDEEDLVEELPVDLSGSPFTDGRWDEINRYLGGRE